MNAQLLAKRQAVLDRIFPNGDELGCHKFRAESGECEQCHIKFTEWLIEQPDGTYRGGMMLCPVIGRDEVARFRNPDAQGDDSSL